MQASVKVMRSFDYCHFEAALSAEVADLDGANELRKQAAILVDEAVRQYKIAKAKESKREWAERQTSEALAEMDRIKEKPRNEWSVHDAALMRAYEDQSFWKDYDREAYCYEYDERDHHFSMLNRFKGMKVRFDTLVDQLRNFKELPEDMPTPITDAAILDALAASEPRFMDDTPRALPDNPSDIF